MNIYLIIGLGIIVVIVVVIMMGKKEGKKEGENPETKKPEEKRPESKTPETKTPETKTPETKNPEAKTTPSISGINWASKHLEWTEGKPIMNSSGIWSDDILADELDISLILAKERADVRNKKYRSIWYEVLMANSVSPIEELQIEGELKTEDMYVGN